MYKFIAIDIDGTLLNSAGEITMRTVDTIKKATEKGVKVVLTSGRVNQSVRGIAKKINADKHIICDNGATIKNLQTDETIYAKYLDKDIVLKLVELCIENNIYYMVFTNKEIIVKDLQHMALAFYKQRHNLKDEASGMAEITFAGLEYIKEVEDPFTRIVICDQDRAIFNAIIQKLSGYEELSLLVAPHISTKKIEDEGKEIILRYSYAEILAKNTNKWTAIEELIKIMNIKKSEVIAIGDNFNDIEMIKNAGLGVAMNNGSPVAKEVAQVIAPSNNEDGVASVLEKYVLS